MLIVGNSKQDINALKGGLSKQFERKNLGAAKAMLGIERIRNLLQRKLTVFQEQYTQHVIERFGMETSRSVQTPMETTILAKVNHE